MNNQKIRKVYSLKINDNNSYGCYYGYNPKQAASKAFSQAFKRKELIFVPNQIYNIFLLNKKEKIIYSFEIKRYKLDNPIIRKIGNKEIVYNFKNKVKFIKFDNFY